MTGWLTACGRFRAAFATGVHRRFGGLLWGVVMAVIVAFPVSGIAAPQDATTLRSLENIEVSQLPGNRIQIKMSMSGATAVPKPLSFTIDNPARIALDFPQTASHVAKRQMIGIGVAQSLNAVEAKGRTRVVLNLDKLVPYETRIENNEVYVILSSTATEEQPAETVTDFLPTAPVAAKVDKEKVQYHIKGIDFHRGTKGEGRLTVTLSDRHTPVNIREVAGKIVVDFADTDLPPELQRRLDVVDFATPVTSVDAFGQGSNTRVVLSAQGRYEHLAYQSDEHFTLEVKPFTPEDESAEKRNKFGYTGEKLSLNFQDIEVRAVLQLIADFTGMNMVTSDTVKGNVTLRLQNVPWDQALDIILKTKGLASRQMGNVILVAPSEEIAAREKLEFESQKQKEELAPLVSDLIQVNYAKAEELASLLKAKENSMLSERGNVTVDERTNTLLVRDTADKLVDIRNLVSKLDIPVRQVLIESRVVVANDDFSRDLGVRLGATYVKANGTNGIIGTTGSIAGTDEMVSTAPIPVSWPSQSNRLNVNLPVTSPTGSIGLAVLGSNYLVDLELSAMQAEGRGEVISSPRVITSNKTEALIEQGVEIPYQEATSSGATSVSFKKAVLSLKARPQITPDDRVILDLAVNKDSVGEVFLGIPSVNTRQVNTQVLVDNGETVVLGGIYEQTRSDAVNKVPLLGSLPIVGALFRQTMHQNDKAELLIFVTPKILKESLSMR